MSKARIIGAGTAGSSIYNTNVNLNTAGGTKKQGYPAAVGDLVNNRAINTRARGENNNIIFPMNQLQGGVHKPIRIYDGNTNFAPYDYYGPKAGAQEFVHFPLAQGPVTWVDGPNSFTVGGTTLTYNGNTTTWENVATRIAASRALFTPADDVTLSVKNRVAMHNGSYNTTIGQASGTALGATLFDIRGAGYLSTIGPLVLGTTSTESLVLSYNNGAAGFQINSAGALAFDATPTSTGLQDGAFGTAGQVLTSQGDAAPPTWTSIAGLQNLASVLALAPAGVALPSQNITLSTPATPSYLGGKTTELNTSDGDISMNGYITATRNTFTQVGPNFITTGEINGSTYKSLDATGDGLRIDSGGQTITVDNVTGVIEVKVGTSTSGQLSSTSMVIDDLGNSLKSTVSRDSLTITDYSGTPINTSYGRTNIQCDSTFTITTADDIIFTPGSQLISTPASTTFVIGQEGSGAYGYYANNTVGVGSDTNYAAMYGFPASNRTYIDQSTSDGKNALFTLEGASPHYKLEANVPINLVSSSVLVNSDPTDTKEYTPNSEFGDSLLVYNDVGRVPLVSDGFAEVIFQNKSATAQSSNVVAICEKDGDHMALGQVSNTAVGSTLFDIRGAGYTSSSGHNIVGSAGNSVVISYDNGTAGLQIAPSGAIGLNATPLVTAGVVTLQDGAFGTAGQVLTSQGSTAPPTWTTVDTTLEQAITNGSGVANSSFQIQETGTSNYSQMADDGFITQNVTSYFPPFTTTTTSNLSPTSLVLTNLTNGSTITATLEKDNLTYAVTGATYEAEYTKDHMRVLDDNGGQPKQTSIYPNQISLYNSTFAVGNRSLVIERNKFQIGSDSGTAGQVIGKDAGGDLAWTTPSTPTLQQVCDVGSTTDTGITVQVGTVSSELDETSLTLTDAVYNTTYKYNEIETDASFTISSDDINIGTTATAGSVITAGWYTNATDFSQTNFRGQAEFVDLCPHTSIEPTFGNDLTNKGYVDRVVGNYSGNGLTLYFNIPSANPNPITSVPISSDLGQTLIAVDATPAANYYTLESTALGLSQHIASFTTAAGFPNVLTIPVGLWSMLVYAFVSGQGGTLNYYFELWETDSAGVEIGQIGTTSGDTSDVNATNVLAPDAYHASLAITSPVSLASTSSRLRIKIYTRGVGMGGSVTLSTLFGGTYYSFITTSLSSSNALLTTNNTWTGTNNFGTGLFSTQTISAPAASSPVSLFTGQVAGGNITIGSAAVDTTVDGTLRATTPLTNTNDTVVPTTSWTTTFFGAKALTNTWDLLQTFTSEILTQGIQAITKASPVSLFTDQVAGGNITIGTAAVDTTINGPFKLYDKIYFDDELFAGGIGKEVVSSVTTYTIPANALRNSFYVLKMTGTLNPTPCNLPIDDVGGKYIYIYNSGPSIEVRVPSPSTRKIFGGLASISGSSTYPLYSNQTLQLYSDGADGFIVLGVNNGNVTSTAPFLLQISGSNQRALSGAVTSLSGTSTGSVIFNLPFTGSGRPNITSTVIDPSNTRTAYITAWTGSANNWTGFTYSYTNFITTTYLTWNAQGPM